jgi:hypothetical protein
MCMCVKFISENVNPRDYLRDLGVCGGRPVKVDLNEEVYLILGKFVSLSGRLLLTR